MICKFNYQVLGVATAILFSSCSGNKHEAHDREIKSDSMAPMKSDPETKPVMTEIKVFEAVDPSVKTQLNSFLTDYFALNKALIEDNNDRAKAAVIKLSETVNKFDMSKLVGEQMDFYHTQLSKLNTAIKGINESADIEDTRLELATVSESIYALVKAYHSNSTSLYYQFCPMAKNGEGANWLSETKEIVNPYMGQRMPNCGRTKETLN